MVAHFAGSKGFGATGASLRRERPKHPAYKAVIGGTLLDSRVDLSADPRLSAVMAQPSIMKGDPPVGRRPCPVCGQPLLIALIEPATMPLHDERTFQCAKCEYAETAIIEFR